jgi:hypothetical protein
MHIRLLAVALAIGFIAGCNCGGTTSTDPCLSVKCGPGLVCDPELVKCVVEGSGGGTGGSTGGGSGGGAVGGGTGGGATGGGGGSSVACTPACTGNTPVCDGATGRCVICTATTGCSGTAPVCFTDANGGLGRCMTCIAGQGCGGDTPYCDVTVPPTGACYQCQSNSQCSAGQACDQATRTCVVNDGGFGGGSGGGTGGGTGGGSGGNTVVWLDGGSTNRCFPSDAGARACNNGECPSGFECISGACFLRGKNGNIQVTLRWPLAEDLDLYVVEPLPDGGACEIFYGQPGARDASVPFPLPFPLPTPPNCGAIGWLDLDSNAGCNIDNVDIENIIYPPQTQVTRGRYTVRANYYQNCSGPSSVPYEVEVRANGQTRFFCGAFTPNQANGGALGAGTVISQFDIQ